MRFGLSAALNYLCHCSRGSNFLCSFKAFENMCLVINMGPSGESPNGKVSLCEWEMHVFPLTQRRALMLANLQIIWKGVLTPKLLPVNKNVSSTYWQWAWVSTSLVLNYWSGTYCKVLKMKSIFFLFRKVANASLSPYFPITPSPFFRDKHC